MKSAFPVFLFIIMLMVSCQNAVGQNFDTVKIETVKITESIYMLLGSGGNIGVLIGNDGIVLIDDQYAPLSEKIKTALKVLSDKPVKFVINTHFHGDHTDGNKNFAGEGAVIVAQDNSRLRMSTDQFLATFNSTLKALPYEALPKVTFSESVTLHMNGQTLQVFHVKNAHTDGDAIIYFKESNVFHAGDVFVRYGLPFIDQSNGGTIDGLIKGIDQLLALSKDDSKIIPGHGALAGKKDVLAYRQMLQTVKDRVWKGIKQGKTLDQINAMDPTKEFVAGFDRNAFVKTVYDSLKK